MAFKLTYKPYGERAILVEWTQVIDGDILKDIINFKQKIKNSHIKSLVELKSAYNSLLIIYNKCVNDFEAETTIIDKIYSKEIDFYKTDSLLWRIPVCYHDEFGLDMELISKGKKLSKEDIIKLHTQAIYTVYFIGFLPGFLYLGGLDKTLHVSRKSTPRLQIEKGAVAIGGNQTGVYPNASPGGWNIIGNSPINFFDASKDQPCFAKSGDRIQFYPISLKEHHDIKTLVDAKVYQIESEVIDD
ncbi:5-oxoprolinase subunit PxpB [Flaviramulus sp. BrNp1-15]|uniref:5-oxoprolinase subunit PxpB n=1 Tax=Flaviramulus sp. BrNp1-15 TaxID=2916754 RepID=UPI001EE7F5C1|nr:5-oxoprolinase subunit PxpB [Flaviramulus sp. BrNp1-15]ULC58474.1 5-oxoprolinase subunit PxpB [Flaviramulus sp. BrNp1-15]